MVCHEDVGIVRREEAIAVNVLQAGDTIRGERGEKGVRETESAVVLSRDRIGVNVRYLRTLERHQHLCASRPTGSQNQQPGRTLHEIHTITSLERSPPTSCVMYTFFESIFTSACIEAGATSA